MTWSRILTKCFSCFVDWEILDNKIRKQNMLFCFCLIRSFVTGKDLHILASGNSCASGDLSISTSSTRVTREESLKPSKPLNFKWAQLFQLLVKSGFSTPKYLRFLSQRLSPDDSNPDSNDLQDISCKYTSHCYYTYRQSKPLVCNNASIQCKHKFPTSRERRTARTPKQSSPMRSGCSYGHHVDIYAQYRPFYSAYSMFEGPVRTIYKSTAFYYTNKLLQFTFSDALLFLV